MALSIELDDPEARRLKKRKIMLVGFCVLLSFSILSYPEVNYYTSKWQTMKAARKLSLYFSMLKTKAILTKSAFEVSMVLPNRIEVYEVSNCGANAKKNKIWDQTLNEFGQDVEFVTADWVRNILQVKDPYLTRFCYDAYYGSSVFLDGLANGSIYLAHHEDIKHERTDQVVTINVLGQSAELSFF